MQLAAWQTSVGVVDAGSMPLTASLTAIAAEQWGVVTRRQLAESNVTRAQVRWQLGRSWRLLLPGVVMLDNALPSFAQRQVAALLYAGPTSWLAGPTAATLYGFLPEIPDLRVHVLVPPTLKPRDVAWVSVRRTHLLDRRIIERGPVRYSCRSRAVVDAAAMLPDDRARGLMIDVVRRRLVRLHDISHWVEARQPNGRMRLRALLAEAAAGTWSLPEADLVALVRTSTVLPTPLCNPGLKDQQGIRLTTPDLWFDDVGMAVMVHSREFHAGALDWDATVTDDSELSGYRIVVIGVTPEQLVRNPRQVLRRIERSYEKARDSKFRPMVVATPRAGWSRMP